MPEADSAQVAVRTHAMLLEYLPIAMFLGAGVVMGVLPMVMGRLLGPHRPYPEKNSAYECGFDAFEDSRARFDVRYYLVAILFIIFDLEIAFLFPWALVLKGEAGIGLFGFLAMVLFLAILVVGFIYEWKKGALEWE